MINTLLLNGHCAVVASKQFLRLFIVQAVREASILVQKLKLFVSKSFLPSAF